jgi:hypothetical protein
MWKLSVFASIVSGAICSNFALTGSWKSYRSRSTAPVDLDMPGKTQGELIRELGALGATLTERVDHLREDIGRIEAGQTRTTEALSSFSTRMAVLEQQVGDIRKMAEESSRRRWALVPPFLAAVIGSLLTLLGQFLFSYLRK